MLEQIFNAPSMHYLSRGIEAASLRQGVIANNIANVNTPEFKKSEVLFEDMLAQELRGPSKDKDGKLKLARTHGKHIGAPKAEKPFRAEPIVKLRTETTMRTDGNNVDIDEEMARLSQNQLYYQAMASSLGGYISDVKSVITSNG